MNWELSPAPRDHAPRTDTFTLTHERVDDIPLLLGLAQRLRRAEVLDRHLGEHHLNQGLSYGTLAVVWIALFLLMSYTASRRDCGAQPS